MRKFIISDIHGFGNVYYSIMSYLDNLSKEENIELFINGDLIDRGYESAEILLDIKRRIKDSKYKITYLGGNHELLMYQEYERRKRENFSYFSDWYANGGSITDSKLCEMLNTQDKIKEVVDFIGNLKIYYKFNEKLNSKNIVLVHAASPLNVLDNCNLKIKDNNRLVNYCVWAREYDPYTSLRNMVGNSKYFTIVGHTPNTNPLGYDYCKDDNYLNIDGGCAAYVSGFFNNDHFPLVEICSGYLKILTFNSNNEIICANYFDGNRSFSYTTLEIEKAREYLDKNVKIKKLSIDENGICGYWK